MGIEIVGGPLDRTLLVANGKGGVGKTSLTANLAAEAAQDGLDVLVVDLDPQGNLAEDYGYTDSGMDDEGQGLAAALTRGAMLAPQRSGRDRLLVVPGGEHLREAQVELERAAERDPARVYRALAGPLARVAGDFDLVVLDSPPGTGALTRAAMGAARWLVIPARDDDSSRKGLRRVHIDYTDARRNGAAVELLAVLLFGTPATATVKRADAMARLAEDLGGLSPRLLEQGVRYSTAASAARHLGLTSSELHRAYQGLPHRLRRRQEPEDLHLPRTPALAAMDHRDLVRAVRATGGNLGALAADYDLLAETLFNLIAAREESIGQLAPAGAEA
jgi:cellulose biosynthesis protein BcsQ